MAWRVTFLGIRDSVKHGVFVDAPSKHIALRLGWDAFVARRTHQRYPVPLKQDYALYSVVEYSDPPLDNGEPKDAKKGRVPKSHS